MIEPADEPGDAMGTGIFARKLLLAAPAFALGIGIVEAEGATPGENGQPAPVQAGSATDRNGDAVPLEEIVVTATTSERSKLRSSASVSTLSAEQIDQSVPGNAADILRNVPGIIAQASGGEGNANVTARGLPQTGGAKFVQFQEDGLPVLDFGDIDFGTADTFIRADYNLDRLEVVRGGSAATFASNAPGGVLNFISRTGETEGGNIGLTSGLGFDQTRLDFDYGGPIDERWRFHVGGFYRTGEGPRTVGYTAESGGQIKGNVTRDFANGFVRLDFKLLDDRTPVYLPVPVSITGSNANPNVASLSGFDVRNGALQSPYFLQDFAIDENGRRVVTNISDGYDSQSQAIGGEASFDLGGGWKLDDKARVTRTSGRFVGPYAAEVNTASALATEIGGTGASLRYATGPQAGQMIADPAVLAGNGLAVRTFLFNVTLNDLGNYANDLRLTKDFEIGSFGTAGITFGYFKARQNLVEDWHWNTYLEEVKGKNAALLDVVNASGQLVTQKGLVAYGEPYFGNCCVRFYDLHYDTDAPYFAVAWERGPLNLDGSLRYDISRANGTYAGSTGTAVVDVNGDGVIEPPENTVPVVNNGAASPVHYTVGYLSYSVGANYLLTPDLALFARVSEGGRANAERLLFGGGIRSDGGISEPLAVNMVTQVEGGAKWRNDHFTVFATLFDATTEDTNQNVTVVTGTYSNRTFEAKGVELEASYRFHGFSVNGGITYTDGKITKDQITPGDVGTAVDPRFIYQLTPAYSEDKFRIGLNFIGTTHNPSGNGLVTPGFIQVNFFASYALATNYWLTVTGNNIFDALGLTEIPNASSGATANGLNTGRSIVGRTIMASLKHSF